MRIRILIRQIVFILLLGSQQQVKAQTHIFSLGDSAFLLDNKPFLMISGEMHYPRIPTGYWHDRMKMAKAMGLNTIGTYVFWNAHEPMPGKYDFSGNNDIAAFLQAAKEEGLWVVLRPSPYACAEWEFGGYPWWLLKDSTVKVRSKDPRFITAYRNYIQQLAKQIVPHLITNGGNVLMIQIENEYGSYSNDKAYLELNRKLFADAGFNCTLFTCDGADKMADGHLPGYLPAVNGLENPAEVKTLINKYHNGKGPYYVAEWYPGWFDNWGKPHASVSSRSSAEKLDKILGAGISINMYMFHGGTTRGFMNGANMNVHEPYSPQVSSYDYDAPLDEAGNPTEKYYAFRNIIAKHLPAGQSLPAVPAKKKTIAIDQIRFTGYANLFDLIPRRLTTVPPGTQPSFEDRDQAYGFMLYRTTLASATQGPLKIEGLRDYAIIYIDGKQIGILDRRLNEDMLQLSNIPAGAVLDILVENNGRINYGPYLTDNRKGITGRVTVNGTQITNWEIVGFPFDSIPDRFVKTPDIAQEQPGLYKGSFTLNNSNDIGDTYLDMRPFGKGFVFLNGHNLGKYWDIGPQQTLYVPAGWLKKGSNEIVVFDALKYGHRSISTISTSILGQAAPAPYGALPSPVQLDWHEMEMYCLVHFGVDTYTDKEWGFGDEDPAIFNPTQFDAVQIVKAAKAGGFKGVIVVAKHHDGLCLWPTETTTHNITKTSYKNGKGDIVEEFKKACEQEGMKLGLYCSPWDRNNPSYGKQEYVNIYREQLKELYSRYGPLFISWHDGANGGDGYYGGARDRRTIDRSTYYGWDTTWQIIRRMQPSAVIFGDIGPDVRWVGNEEGYAGETCWATYTPEAPEPGKKPSYGYVKYEQGIEGTRNGKYWMPAECDVPLRPGWFYHPAQDNQVKSPAALLDLYYKSVGRGANLDLGIAPDRRGLLHDNDVKALQEFGGLLQKTFAVNLAKGAKLTASNTRFNDTKKYGASFLLDDDRYSYWATDDKSLTAQLIIDLTATKTFDVIRLRENIKLGQRIDSFAVDILVNNQWKEIAKATSIGANRLLRLSKPVTAKQVRLRITGAKACIALSDFGLFKEAALSTAAATGTAFPFRNGKLSIEERVKDLLGRLTTEEKISLLGYNSKAVPRLGIPAYNWWNEALHGVARAGKATVFPQAIGMASSFNDELLYNAATVISTEARAKYNLAVKQDRRLQYMGLTFWSPNINIFRDPRWGRGQETYGEDPFLTASMGTAFVKGLQGNNPRYLKASAGAKHFAVHSGPEAGRHTFDAIVDEKDLRETYLYAFKKLVDGGVETVMCAYNRVNGEPCCTGNTLLQTILRKEWKFKGHVVTDCWALEDVWLRHKALPNSVATAAAAIKAGVNLDCSNLLQDDVLKALQQNLLTINEVDSSLAGILRTQVKLGFFDEPTTQPFAKYGEDSVSNPYHTMLARKMAQQSMVLLKNGKNILPLNKTKYGAIMVVGPNAASLDALLGNYHGVSDKAVNFVEGITAAVNAGTRVEYDQGSDYTDTTHFGGTWAAGNADITIAVIGFTPVYEGEEGDAFLAAGRGDRHNLSLPAAHIAYMKALRKAHNKPIIAVITTGSAVDISSIEPYADAIILAWYPGEQGGNALADIIFGNVSPAGRLPVTFYQSFDDLPSYDSYAMKGRTYRYFNGKVQYPFGFGLSYTSFDYAWQTQPATINEATDILNFSVRIKNTGSMDGDEVAQLYIQYPAGERMPLKELKGFKRVHIRKGQEQLVKFSLPATELQKWDMKQQKWILYPGDYTILIGSSSEDIKLNSIIKAK